MSEFIYLDNNNFFSYYLLLNYYLGNAQSMFIRYTFLLNHNIHKRLYGLCFWAPNPLINRFYLNLSIKGSEVEKKGQMNFYECCDLTKKYI